MDKNGKLFGKINIIDLLVLILAVGVVIAVALKMTGRAGPARVEQPTNITYTVAVENIDNEVYENIARYIDEAKANGNPGDQLMASGELLNGYVTAVTATPRSDEAQVLTSTGGVTVQAGQKDRVDLVFDIQAHVANNVKTELGTQEVRVGKSHIVKTTHFELQYGIVLNCDWESGTGAGF